MPEASSTPSEAPTPEPSPSPSPEQSPAATQTEQIQIETPQEATSAGETSETTASEDSPWIVNDDGGATTRENVAIGVAYRVPQNNSVTIAFVLLPDAPGTITVREILLSREERESLGALTDTAYEIISTMENGTFTYDLTLPLPPGIASNKVNVKYAENEESLEEARILDQPKETASDTITIRGLDHFTIFVVTADILPLVGQACIDAGADAIDLCFTSISDAIAAASPGDTINVAAGTYELSAQINITDAKPVSIIGQGAVTFKAITDYGNTNGSKHLLTLYGGTEVAPVTISGITLDCDSKCYGLNTYDEAYGVLNDVTIKNSKGAALTVNGSTIVATNLNTSGNAWGAVNVDPGSGVTTPSVFTLNSGTLAEDIQIWSDGAHVSETATVTVTAAGYTMYSYAGTTVSQWANRALTNVATIASAPTVLYTLIQDAINAASPDDTINVAAGTYTEQLTINKNLTIAGAASAIIETTTTLALESDGDGRSIVEITGASTTAIFGGFTVRGALGSITSAIHVHGGAAATIQDNKIEGTDALGGGLIGHGITVGSSLDGDTDTAAATSTISNNQLSGFHRAGIVVAGAGNNAAITGNTITGNGPITSTTQQGITIQDGATDSITNNTVSAVVYTGAAPQTAVGIFLLDSANGISISGNTVTNSQTGIMVQAAENIQISNNTISVSTSSATAMSGANPPNGVWLVGRGATGTGCADGDGSTPGLGCRTAATLTGNTITGGGTGYGAAIAKNPGFTPASTTAVFTNDTISGWARGLFVEPSGTANAVSANQNTIQSNGLGLENTATEGVDATNNWWGVPNPVFSTLVSGNATTTPWLDDVPSTGNPRSVNIFIDANANGVFDTGEATFNMIQAAVNATTSTDTIKVLSGTYAGKIAIGKPLILKGPNAGINPNTGVRVTEAIITGTSVADPIIEMTSGDLSGLIIDGFTVSNVTTVGQQQIVHLITDGNNIAIRNNRFLNNSGRIFISTPPGGPRSGLVIANNLIDGMTQDNQAGMQLFTMNNCQITNNVIKNTTYGGIQLGSASDCTISGNRVENVPRSGIAVDNSSNIMIENNTVTNAGRGQGAPATNTGNDDLTENGGVTVYNPDQTNITIDNNTLSGNHNGLAIRQDAGQVLGSGISFQENSISGNVNKGVENLATSTSAALNAANNWWGDADGPGSSVSGNVTFNPWYINPARSVLSNAISDGAVVSTSGDFDFATSTAGGADLPGGVTEVTLSDTTALAVTNNISVATSGTIMIAGATTTLSNFTSGTLSSVNLAVPQTVGTVHLLVEKAVQLSSGSSTQPIILKNTSLTNAVVAIPDDTTILAPAGWNAKINPPKTASPSGAPPSGFSIGSTVIEVGSPDVVLLFDKPVTFTLSGVTGDMAYKAAGTTDWVRITTTCGGTFENPANPAFPSECSISNGLDTRIVTYHFTAFGELNPLPPPPSEGGGGRRISPTPSPTQEPIIAEDVLALPVDLGQGMTNEYVWRMQGFLASDPSIYPEGFLTGYYGALTAMAVKRFQERYGINSTGYTGLETRIQLLVISISRALKPFQESTIPAIGQLDPGSRDGEVRLLQEFLAKDPSVYPEGLVTGYYGPLTTAAVGRFQRKYDIYPSGHVGPETAAKINELIKTPVPTPAPRPSPMPTEAPAPKSTPAPPATESWPMRVYRRIPNLFKILIDLVF